MSKLQVTVTAVCDAGDVYVFLDALVKQSGACYHIQYEPDLTCD